MQRIKRYASIHPIHRRMEWSCKKDKMAWLSEDTCPTIVVNMCRGCVIWEVYDEEDNSL